MKTIHYYFLAAFLATASEIEPTEPRTVFAYPCYVQHSWCFFDRQSPTNEAAPLVVQVDSCECRKRIKLREPNEYYYPAIGDTVRINSSQGKSYCGRIREIQH